MKGFPAPLPWCSSKINLSVGSKRLCSDCRKERRREMGKEELDSDSSQKRHDRRAWKIWTSKEGAEAREQRKRLEEERQASWLNLVGSDGWSMW